jgi:nickel-dependent lactate racemase
MEYLAAGGPERTIDNAEAGALLDSLIETLEAQRGRPLKRVLIVPPDATRFHSAAGELTCHLYERLKSQSELVILPALGTHFPMEAGELDEMFPGVPHRLFRIHDWRNGTVTLGEVPGEFVAQISGNRVDYPVAVQVNRLYFEQPWDAIFSIGQLVPHEVSGIANGAKNVLVGTGGRDFISKSHFLGAAVGMETLMGKPTNAVRDLFNHGMATFLQDLPIIFILTVRAKNDAGELITRGLFAGTDDVCFQRGAALCRQVNLTIMPREPKKVVVYLDPKEFKTTWLGNKAVYRTRMAIADEGELIVLAPGVRQFGEDAGVDKLIRRHGYRGTPATLAAVRKDPELANDLSAAAHLIHGSSEGRFLIRYCPGQMTQEEIEGAGFAYGDLSDYAQRYNPAVLKDGWVTMPDGEEIFYISNPALGLWGTQERFGTAL